MGQYSSKSAVSLLAQNKKSTECRANGKENIIRRLWVGKLNERNSEEILPTIEKTKAIQIPPASTSILSLASNRITTTTINLHIENNGGVSTTTTATTSSQGVTRTIESAFETSCDLHYCQCANDSPRQLIIKIQLSKMEQTNAESQTDQQDTAENVTFNKHFPCCDINHNKNIQTTADISSSSNSSRESQETASKTNGVSVYVPKNLLSQDCSNECASSSTSKQHSKIEMSATSSGETKGIESKNKSTTVRGPTAHSQVDFVHHLVPDLDRITNASYYWGKMDRYEAERLLEDKEEGTFLLRDSAQDDFLFSVTFRKYGLSLHARIEQSGNQFSFDCHDPSCICAPTITELLEHYKDPSCVMFFEPRLTIPLRRPHPFSLQQLCRAKIVSLTTYDGINQLELPSKLKSYLKEFHYKQKLCTRSLESNRNYA